MPKIVLIPTSHIAKESIQRVKEAIAKEKPDLVAVEMDLNRFMAMRKGEASSNLEIIKALGITTFLVYFVFKSIQKWLGKKVNIFPGSEMMQAVKIAEKRGLKIAFIDRDIRETFLRIKEISRREKLKLVWFVVKGLTLGFVLPGKKHEIDLSKVPSNDLINQAISLLRKEFPELYRALVEERDAYMAKALIQLSKQFKTIVAVVGAGHCNGLIKRLSMKN